MEAAQQAELEKLRGLVRAVREAGRCPIRHGLCRRPVVASDGQTYDAQAIRPWLRQHGTSPLTREALQQVLFPNRFAIAVLQLLQEAGVGSSDSEDEDEGEDEELPDGQDVGEERPLMAAIDRHDVAAALAILQQPTIADLNTHYDEEWGSVLHWAIFVGQTEVALAIMRREDFELLNVTDVGGQTALHYAAEQGHVDVCQGLLGHPNFVGVEAVDGEGQTALHRAEARGHQDVVELLQRQ